MRLLGFSALICRSAECQGFWFFLEGKRCYLLSKMSSNAKSLEKSVVDVFDLNIFVPLVYHLYRMADLTECSYSVNVCRILGTLVKVP